MEKPPFTGNGFTKSANGHIVPEFHQPEIKKLNPGTKIYELKANGEMNPLYEFTKDNEWKKIRKDK